MTDLRPTVEKYTAPVSGVDASTLRTAADKARGWGARGTSFATVCAGCHRTTTVEVQTFRCRACY